jgi:hypothetical protein
MTGKGNSRPADPLAFAAQPVLKHVGAEAVCATLPAPATETTSVRALLREAKAPGPRDADLIRLPDLAGLLACAEGLTLYEAGRLLLDALAGREKWAGLAPAGLVLYRCTVSGPVPANADLIEFEEGGQLCQFPSDRAAWLSEYRVPLALEGDLAAVKPGAYGVPAPRFVAVVRDDALRAFGLDAPALPVAPLSLGAKAAPVVPAAAPPAPAPGAVAVPLRAVPASPAPEDRPARIARAAARVRALQASNSRGVRETVAGEFGVSLRTVGKWLAEVERKEAEAYKAGMFNSLRAGAAGRK